MTPFPCNQCGKCCANVHLSELTAGLDRGDGVCRHLDPATRLCSIYATRPEICRIDVQYALHYSQAYPWDTFVALNLEICEALPQGNLP
ncbi:YkgJ family cysteine cluster protein [Enterobacter sp.]|uniref:YkgJ family cysteine cluster protein n=1 Tax=Enterobacter sp. TaxID=42895 RepID=UPI00296E981F|nr:YkgJ family cysteine cluster protein [Enterobacter sp.]